LICLISGHLNDLWKFESEEWVWVSGSNTTNQNGIYGEKGIPDSSNVPGGRYHSVSWIDNSGNMWLFGGHGYSANSSSAGNAIDVNYNYH
jgi:hypothetical protein